MKTLSTSLGVLTLAVLSACGGGGGDSDGGAVTGPPVAVTASNYQTVAVESASVVNDMVDTSGLTTLVGVRSNSVGSVVPVIVRGLPGWLAAATHSPPVLVGVVQSVDIPCTTGSMNLSLNDVNNNTDFDVGESISVRFTNCSNAGATLSGTMTLVANAQPVGLGTSTGSLDLTVTLSQLDMVDATTHLHANGAMRVASTRTAVDTGIETISTALFSETNTVANVTSTRTLKDFQASTMLQAGLATTTYSGTLTSSALAGGSVTFGSTTAFITQPGALYPSAGVARAVGANGGAAVLTVIDASSVRVDLDVNGDGTSETSTTRAWSSIF